MKTNQSQANNYLSTFFTEEDFANMTPNKMYAFYSAPDTGKTTLITEVLQPYLIKNNKTALYLTSRCAILDQIRNKITSEAITTRTYQSIETALDSSQKVPCNYDFIICDEAHYFLEDSMLTNKTDLSFNFVNQSNAIVILMTGTPDYVNCLKNAWRRPLKVLIDLDTSNHNVTNVILAPALPKGKGGDFHLLQHLKLLVSQRKRIMVYGSNLAELRALFTQYESQQESLGIKVSFICSTHNKQYPLKDQDKETLKKLIDTEEIDTDVLFLTSALNTGISINQDFDCLFIFGCPSKTAVFQLVARVRKGSTNRQWPMIFCSVPLYHTIKTKHDSLHEQLMYVDQHDKWGSNRRRLPPFTYEDKSHEVVSNKMAIAKYRQDIKDYKELLSCSDMTTAYTAMFNDRYDNITIVSLGVFLLVNLLNTYSNLPYLAKEQQRDIKALCKDHNIPMSISKINEQLSFYGYNLQLQSMQKKVDAKNCQVWKVER